MTAFIFERDGELGAIGLDLAVLGEDELRDEGITDYLLVPMISITL